MKKIIYALLVLLAAVPVCSTVASAALLLSTSPSSINVARGIPGTATLMHRVTQGPAGACTIISAQGLFFTPDETQIGANPVGISVPVINTRGISTEVVTVPVAVMERALKRKVNRIIYSRDFTGCDDTFNTYVTINITGEADADFRVNRMDLYFENRRAEITVPRNTPHLKAFVDIRFTGTGLFEGDWRVDGRTIQHVSQHVIYGRSLTLSSPEIPSLPTFNEGSHVVQFVITNPETGIAMPSIVYFVEPKEAKRIEMIRLISPVDRAAQDYAPTKFEWEKLGKPFQYLIGFYEKDDGGVIFSALTKDDSYTLPDAMLKKTFSKGKMYYWKVVAFEEENAVAGESKMQSFSFK